MKFSIIMMLYTVNYKSETFQTIIQLKSYILSKTEKLMHQLREINP